MDLAMKDIIELMVLVYKLQQIRQIQMIYGQI